MGVSLTAFALLVMPVFALFLDLPDLAPTVRVLQKNENHLVRQFFTDVDPNSLSNEAQNDNKVMLTKGNIKSAITGLKNSDVDTQLSEVTIYFGVIILLLIIYSFSKKEYYYPLIFLILAALIFLIMTGIGNTNVVAGPSINQIVIIKLFPFLKSVNVLQNFGTMFIFCLIVLAACGSIAFNEHMQKNKSNLYNIIYLLVGIVVCFKYAYLLLGNKLFAFLSLPSFLFAGDFAGLEKDLPSLISVSFFIKAFYLTAVFCLFCLPPLISLLMHKFKKGEILLSEDSLLLAQRFGITVRKRGEILFSMGGLLLVDSICMLFFASYPYFNKEFADYINVNGLYSAPRGNDFVNERVLTVYPESSPTQSFFGLEIYQNKKAAFPAVIEKDIRKTPIPLYDHFFMTRYYYDYIAHVPLDKQAIFSGINGSIIRYFNNDDVVYSRNKYKMVEDINKKDIPEIRNTLFIEEDLIIDNEDSISFKIFFNRYYYMRYSDDEIASLYYAAAEKTTPANANYKVVSFDVNSLTVDINAEQDGYLYYSDGFDKCWNAYVDNKPAIIRKANINFKAVPVSKGNHTVKFEYVPKFFKLSLIAFLLGNMIFMAAFIAALRLKPQI
jgi:hypothetical protein